MREQLDNKIKKLEGELSAANEELHNLTIKHARLEQKYNNEVSRLIAENNDSESTLRSTYDQRIKKAQTELAHVLEERTELEQKLQQSAAANIADIQRINRESQENVESLKALYE